MQREELQACAGIVIGCGANAVALSIPALWPHAPWYLWFGILFFGVILIAAAVIVFAGIHMGRRAKLKSAVSLLVLFAAFGVWYYFTHPYQPPVSLLELYVTDHGDNYFGLRAAKEISVADGSTIKMFATKHYDHVSNSYFVSIYVPRTKYYKDICNIIPIDFPNRVLKAFMDVVIDTRIPGDSSTMSDNDLQFAGRVYLYVDDDVTPDEIGEFYKKYRQNGLYMEFRGYEYQNRHFQDYSVRDSAILKDFKNTNKDLFPR
jgi:hypothetical protein